MENLNEVVRLADSIKDQAGSVDEQADAISSVHWATDVRELLQKIDVIKDGFTESLCAGGKNVPRVGKDFFKIC
jgi:hypothetical protein